MPFDIACGGCGTEYTVDDALIGKTGKCGKCGARIQISASLSGCESPIAESLESALNQPTLPGTFPHRPEDVRESVILPNNTPWYRVPVLTACGITLLLAIVLVAATSNVRQTHKPVERHVSVPTPPPTIVSVPEDTLHSNAEAQQIVRDAEECLQQCKSTATKHGFAVPYIQKVEQHLEEYRRNPSDMQGQLLTSELTLLRMDVEVKIRRLNSETHLRALQEENKHLKEEFRDIWQSAKQGIEDDISNKEKQLQETQDKLEAVKKALDRVEHKDR